MEALLDADGKIHAASASIRFWVSAATKQWFGRHHIAAITSCKNTSLIEDGSNVMVAPLFCIHSPQASIPRELLIPKRSVRSQVVDRHTGK